MTRMCDLVAELRRCEADTRKLLSEGAAQRLSNWQAYESDQGELIAFVQRVIRGHGQLNGWELQRQGGRSLERIVIDCGSPTFTEDDIRVARGTLGV